MEPVTVIGGGIGGLTLGTALQQNGVGVEIYEAADEFRPVGAGIILLPNAIQVLDRLGIAADIKQVGCHHEAWHVVDMDGETVYEINLDDFIKPKFGHASWCIRRATLQEILVDHVGTEVISMGKECVDVDEHGDAVEIRFADGTEVYTSNVVVGADGMHSTVRGALFPDVEVNHVHTVGHRGIPEAVPPEDLRQKLLELWVEDGAFGFAPFTPNGRTGHWFANFKAEPGQTYAPVEVKRKVLDRFSGAPDPVVELLESTPPETILSHDYADVPPMDSWSKGRVVLLGDAAHGMTPSIAQGGGQAIEDAYVLAGCLAGYASVREAFTAYENRRMDRAYTFVELSREVGQASTYGESAKLQKFRDLPPKELQKMILAEAELNF